MLLLLSVINTIFIILQILNKIVIYFIYLTLYFFRKYLKNILYYLIINLYYNSKKIRI